MSDEQPENTEATPIKRGRPVGAKNKPKKRTVERGPLHEPTHRPLRIDEDDLESFEPTPYAPRNPLAIDAEVLWQIEHEFGYVLQWCCEEVLGKVFAENITARKRNRFQEVTPNSFGGVLKPYFGNKDGAIRHEGLLLMAVPKIIWDKIKRNDYRAAKGAVNQMQASHSTEGVNVSMPGGGSHASALNSNKHAHSYERYTPEKIPD